MYGWGGLAKLQRLTQLLTQVILQVRSLDPAVATMEAPAFSAVSACALLTSLVAIASMTRGTGGWSKSGLGGD